MPQTLAAVHPEPQPAAPASNPSSHRRTVWAAAFVAVILVIFFAPALGPDEFIARDTGRLHGPMKQWIADELARGRLPQWNPYSGLGLPVIANGIDAVQHPFTLLLAVLPAGATLKTWILLSFAAAAAGAFTWVRLLGVSPLAAAIGAFAFALSGPLLSSSDNVTYLTTYAAIPLVLAATHRFLDARTPGSLALVALASFFCAAGGDPQGWAIVIGLLPPYGFVCARQGERRRNLARGLTAAGVAGLAAAPVILPIVSWIPYALRARGIDAADLARWNLHPHRLFELGLPDLFRGEVGQPQSPIFDAFCGDAGVPWFVSVYVGVSVLALASLAAIRESRARLLCAAALAFAWAALGHHAGFGELAAAVPILRSFRYWEKLTVWVALLVGAAAAIGLDAMLARPGRRFPVVTACAGLATLGIAALAAAAPEPVARLTGGPHHEALALAKNLSRAGFHAGAMLTLLGAIAAAVSRPAFSRMAHLLLAAVVAADLFGANAGAYVLGPRGATGTPPLARIAATGAGVLSPFASNEERWPELGIVAGTWEWGRRTIAASWNVAARIRNDVDYVGLREARWAQLKTELAGPRMSRLGLFGFGLVVVPGDPRLAAKVGAIAPYRTVGSDPELPAWLVEQPHRPRVYVAEEVATVDEAGAHAFAAAGGEPRKTVVEGPIPPGSATAHGDARIVSEVPGRTETEARADEPALLVLNDALAPGWTAEVDGRRTEIVRVNWVVRGVWIPAGTHRAVFTYRTPGLLAGWGVALALAIALAAWSVTRRGRPRRDALGPPTRSSDRPAP